MKTTHDAVTNDVEGPVSKGEVRHSRETIEHAAGRLADSLSLLLKIADDDIMVDKLRAVFGVPAFDNQYAQPTTVNKVRELLNPSLKRVRLYHGTQVNTQVAQMFQDMIEIEVALLRSLENGTPLSKHLQKRLPKIENEIKCSEYIQNLAISFIYKLNRYLGEGFEVADNIGALSTSTRESPLFSDEMEKLMELLYSGR